MYGWVIWPLHASKSCAISLLATSWVYDTYLLFEQKA